jgi:hypothetical protein
MVLKSSKRVGRESVNSGTRFVSPVIVDENVYFGDSVAVLPEKVIYSSPYIFAYRCIAVAMVIPAPVTGCVIETLGKKVRCSFIVFDTKLTEYSNIAVGVNAI